MTDLEKLKDDNEYYRGVGKNYLSNSDIGTLLSNPKDFGKDREDTTAMLLGRYFHTVVLEPEKKKDFEIVDASTRNTGIYKKALEESGQEILLLRKEAEELDGLVKVMTSNLDFYEDIYAPGNQYEVPGIIELEGLMWKGKTDILGGEFLFDIKTTSDIEKFRWSAYNYNYDSQAFIYGQIFGKPMVFLVICKKTGMLGKFYTSPEFLESGEKKVKRAVEVYNRFFGENPTEDVENYYIEQTL